MSLHVIGGKFQNRKLKTAKHITLRPTMSMLRETVFNMCQNYIQNARFLDLFSGSGAMGIEAISRGASFAVFVEKDYKSVSLIQQNISLLEIEDQTEVIRKDIFIAFKILDDSFDIVYIDPPYELFESNEEKIFLLFQKLMENNILKPNATIFLEGPYQKSKLDKPYEFPSYKCISARKVGKSLLLEYQNLK